MRDDRVKNEHDVVRTLVPETSVCARGYLFGSHDLARILQESHRTCGEDRRQDSLENILFERLARSKDETKSTYCEFFPHLSLFSKVRVVDLLPNDRRELE